MPESLGSVRRAHRGDCAQGSLLSGFQRQLRGRVPLGPLAFQGQNGPFLPWASDLVLLANGYTCVVRECQ